MVSLFILVCASLALVQFAISQWRAIWLIAANQPLSDTLPNTAGMDSAAVEALDFRSLLDLCDRLSPDLRKESPRLREVSLYYRAVAKLELVFRLKLPSLSTWATREMQTCSRYVAVALDQSLSMNLARQPAAPVN